jgi:Fe-S-cluster containining protein
MNADSNERAGETKSDTDDVAQITLEITIGGEPVRFTVTVPRGPATWEHLLPFMRALIQVSDDIAQEQAGRAGRRVSCRAGCGICCRQRVPIAPLEAHRLRRLVEQMPEPRRSRVIARFREAEARVKAAGDAVSLDSPQPLTLEEMTRRAANYFRLMIACPFLEEESCSIYEERPLKCREHMVTSPAASCADPDQPGVEPLPLPLRVFLTTLLLEDDSQSPGVRWVPLHDLLSWTQAHPPVEPARTGPQLLHEFMNRLSRPAQGL